MTSIDLDTLANVNGGFYGMQPQMGFNGGYGYDPSGYGGYAPYQMGAQELGGGLGGLETAAGVLGGLSMILGGIGAVATSFSGPSSYQDVPMGYDPQMMG